MLNPSVPSTPLLFSDPLTMQVKQVTLAELDSSVDRAWDMYGELLVMAAKRGLVIPTVEDSE